MQDDDVRETMAEFHRALLERDRTLAEECLHEAFALVLVQPAPVTMPRSRWLEVLPDYLIHEWLVEETSTAIDGDCATVHQRVAMRATVLGDDRSGVFVMTDVWRDGPGGWRLWRRFSTPMTAGPMPD